MKVIDAGQWPVVVRLAQWWSAQLLHFAAAEVTFVVLTAGVGMPLLFDVLASAALVVGGAERCPVFDDADCSRLPGLAASLCSYQAVADRGGPREAWQWFRFSLFCVFDGMFILDRGWASATTRWLVVIAAAVVLLWDRGLWLRSRLRRYSAN